MTRANIGKPLPRIESEAKVTGARRYTADVIRPGSLWGKIVRSTLPHARILNVDVTKARALTGVKAVITGADIKPHLVGAKLKDLPVLARDRVLYAGQDVAAVAAVDRETADEAAQLIDIEYEELPAVFDPLEALTSEAPLLHPDYDTYEGPKAVGLKNVQSVVQIAKGDFDRALAECDEVFENVYRTQMAHQAYIEPYACMVDVDVQGRVEIWVADQGFFKLRRELAHYLESSEDDIVVHPSIMGGSFGAKDFLYAVPAAYHLSKFTGKPVRFVRSYAEEFLASAPRHPAVVVLKAGVKKGGILWAWEGKTFYNAGAYAAFRPNPQASMSGAFSIAGCYAIPHTRMTGTCVYTNQLPCGYFRAPGEPQTLFAVESHIDTIAIAMGLDPIEFRCRNVLKQGDTRPTGEPIKNPHGLDVLKRARAVSRWRERRSRPKASNGRIITGRGIALGDRHIGRGESSFIALLQPDGSVKLISGVGDTGVGSYTMHQQVAAERLGVASRHVEIEVQETSTAPFDEGIKATRGVHIEGQAVMRATDALIQNLRAAATAHWRTGLENVSYSRGKVFIQGGKFRGSLTLRELAAFSSEPIRGFGHYSAAKPNLYSFQAVVAEILIDTQTGQIQLPKAHFILDVGTIINPLIHQGQIEGAFIQGLGYALTEKMGLDEGRVTTLSLGEYKIPSICDIPRLITSLVRCNEGPGPFGAKAVGQVAISLVAPAVANAVYNATGIRISELPITSEAILLRLTQARTEGLGAR
ncbi:MAG TPA: xanthine dehydrogenase family protein molybdopterin-binding subunit [Candidatus Binatia bacterium]|jgi:CO/xanthine dehydrogenase Mo-binding subunit